jgi:hypothetical protein
MSDLTVPLGPSKAQLENLVTDNVERMHDHGLSDWLPEVESDVSQVEVGVWRCQSGEVTCDEGCCGDCDCCGNAGLWESPLNADLMAWEPQCGECGRKAFLVEVVGCFDYSAALA